MGGRTTIAAARVAPDDMPTIAPADARAWDAWLRKQHRASNGAWVRLTRKMPGVESLTHAQALDVALCYSWIDGQARGETATTWVCKFTPRRKRSIWSKNNRKKVEALIAAGRMQPAGLAEIERAKQDGRWDAAYDSWSEATAPPDLEAALDAEPRARAAFDTLDRRNRYAIFFRTHTAKKPETRAKRIAQFVAMLARGETIYP
jgi:uncharacterized protein YdeI (YjbR/CyaY-like superfamily)